MRIGPDQPEHAIDLVVIRADQESGVAATQETASAGEAGRAKILIQERIDHIIGIVILDDGNDQFFHESFPLPRSSRVRYSCEYSGGRSSLPRAPSSLMIEIALEHDRCCGRVDLDPTLGPASSP